MNRDLAKHALELFPKQHILVVGDLMMDEYLWGNTERISPEAPVQVVEVRNQQSSLGGAGNVAANLVSLGGNVSVAGVIGADPNGLWIQNTFQTMGINQEGIFPDDSRPTTKKTRVIAANQQIVRIDWEKKEALHPEYVAKILTFIKKNINSWDAIIISDYDKGLLTQSLLEGVIREANTHSKWIIVDPKGVDFSRYRGASLLTPNRKEALLASGGTSSDLAQIGSTIIRDLSLKGLIITLGQDGMYVFSPPDDAKIIPTKARDVFDVSGAGDTVIATLTLCLAGGLNLHEAASMANVTAGIVVGKVGTATVNPSEILAFYGEANLPFHKKAVSFQDIGKIIKGHRIKGERIAFTNGCFDLLHLGHIKLLHEARSFANLLVVGLNSDSSVRKLKGASRPCLDQNERAQILSALDCVDYVVLFEEETPLRLIEAIRPDILVKGADYKKDEVVGADVVEKYGGTIQLVDLVKYRSTSTIIQQIIKNHQE
ncbi:MAG: D-glycero-beta-D-manno-heptose-7-phosphate kinase [bacterium]